MPEPAPRAARISRRGCSRALTCSIKGRHATATRLRPAPRSFPGRSFAGQHDFKTGVSLYWDRTSDAWLNNEANDGPYGNYVLITDRINGVSGTPYRIRAYNTPVFPLDNEDIFAWYFKDSWRVKEQTDAQSRRAMGVSALVSAGAGVRRRPRFPDGVSGQARRLSRRADVQPGSAAAGRGLRHGRQVGHQGDLGTLQLHSRRHIRRRVRRNRHRECPVPLARSEQRQVVDAE